MIYPDEILHVLERPLAGLRRVETDGVTRSKKSLSSDQLAHILATAVQGFKESARSVVQLRQMIEGLISIILAGLQNQSHHNSA